LWAAHRSAKKRLLEYVVTTRHARKLDPDVLTIGFARRFATYKRASLLFSRPDRLAKLLADPERPIQGLLDGKAPPADDGWWAEAYSPACGFAIGDSEGPTSDAAQDEADAEALYAVLEGQVLPAYYERDEAGLPQRWIELMRESIAELGPRFGTARMVAEYVERLYLPAHEGASRVASRVA